MMTAEQRKASYEKRGQKRRATMQAKRERGAMGNLTDGEILALDTLYSRGRKKARGGRGLPYPKELNVQLKVTDTLRAAKDGETGACAAERAVRRSLFYYNLVPRKVLIVGNMVAAARRTSPRGVEEEWFEYLCTEKGAFRNHAYRAAHGHVIRKDRAFTFTLLRSYRVKP